MNEVRFNFNDGEAQDDGLVTVRLSMEEIRMLTAAVRITVDEYTLADVEEWYTLHGKLKALQGVRDD